MAEPPSTPQKSVVPSAKLAESPWVRKHTQSAPADINCEDGRALLLKDLREEVNEVEADFFFRGLLPKLSPSLLHKVEENLKKEGKIRVNRRSGRPSAWTQYFTKNPSRYTELEDDVFADLETLIDDIRAAADLDSTPTLRFVCRPTKSPGSSTRDNPSKPDSYGVLYQDEQPRTARWVEIAVPGEFKKGAEKQSRNDDAKKVLWSMYHILREDPTRRFVYGFTIEDDEMRMWFVSRSEVFVSWNLNFVKDPHSVIMFFLSLLFADRIDLGWDNTIERVSAADVTKNIVYKIKVGDTQYITKRLISSIGAEAIHGRGTRVWEVVKLDDDGKETGDPQVLKDFWTDADRKPEGNILDKIRKSGTPEQSEKIQQHFMKLAAHDYVLVGRYGNQIDHTHVIMRKAKKPASITPLKVQIDATTKRPQKLPVKGAFTLPTPPPDTSDIKYSAKVHYRIVFSELGKTVMEINSLKDAFFILADAVEGLREFHACGWVHRDISAGNILAVKERAKITDVEYAKKMSDLKIHGVRTGTPYFMAVEVEFGEYLWPTPMVVAPVEKHKINFEIDMDEVARRRQAQKADAPKPQNSRTSPTTSHPASQQPTTQTQPAFRQNQLHDIESIFWLALWLLLCTKLLPREDMDEAEWDTYMEHHSKIAADLFSSRLTRFRLMTGEFNFAMEMNNLHPLLRPIGEVLELFRRDLVTRYKEVETNMASLSSINPADGMHKKARGYLNHIYDVILGEADFKIDVVDESEQERAIREATEKARAEADQPLEHHPEANAETDDVGEAEEAANDTDDQEDPEGSSRVGKKRKATRPAPGTHRMRLRYPRTADK